MGGLEKTDDDVDCRAISDVFLKKFLPKESENEKEYNYNAFLELVKKYSDELVLCFRGNNAGSEAVCIYYKSHLVYKIQNNDRITISFNHARYSENYEDYWKWITRDYGFTPVGERREEKVPTIKVRKEGNSYSTSIGEITGCFKDGADISDNVKKIYEKCLQPMMKTFFEPDMIIDYFRDTANGYPEYKGKIAKTKRKKNKYLEKKRQQQLFCAMKSTQNGLFVFDMEFAQKSSKGTEDNEENGKNQPDMLAIRFQDGCPVAYVLVEVKSTEGACNGKSGIREHLEKMEKYLEDKELMKARRIEAARIIKCYKELGLYPSLGDIDEKDYEKIDKVEILLIVTDDAVSVCESIFNNDKELRSRYKKMETENWGDIRLDDIGFKMEMYGKC